MKAEKVYEIFTDASFDDETKVGTYAIVITQKNKIIKAFGKKCKMQLENCTECEIFAIYQVLNLIESNLMQNNLVKKICVKTDCRSAIEIFKKDSRTKTFNNNIEFLNDIKDSYKRLKEKLSKESCNLELKWISRKSNKTAHKYSHSIFREERTKNRQNNISLSEIKIFLNLLQNSKILKMKKGYISILVAFLCY